MRSMAETIIRNENQTGELALAGNQVVPSGMTFNSSSFRQLWKINRAGVPALFAKELAPLDGVRFKSSVFRQIFVESVV